MSCFACDAGIPAVKVVTVPMVQFTQFRFPRSKKVRVRKKWAKRQENWRFKDVSHFAIDIETINDLRPQRRFRDSATSGNGVDDGNNLLFWPR